MNDMSKPVYPFKTGDIVECMSAENMCTITEGLTYRVTRSRLSYECGVADNNATVFITLLRNDHGLTREYVAARFCAPGESRVALRRRIAELENTLKDTRINSVASGLRDELDRQIAMREETARAFVAARDAVAQADGRCAAALRLNEYQAGKIRDLLGKRDRMRNALREGLGE